MADRKRPAGRALRLSGLPGASEQPYAGGPQFVAYCLGADVRARQRRDAITRAHSAHKRAMQRDDDPYPTALILCQRLGVPLEDLARLVLAFESVGEADLFTVLRSPGYDKLDYVFRRLQEDPAALRAAFTLPTAEDAGELGDPLGSAVLAASNTLAARWLGQWERCVGGWDLLRRLAKALRHGSPLLPRELVLGPPGAGWLGDGIDDAFERWVLLVDTGVDHDAERISTTYAAADISEGTLARARHAGLDAVALARGLADAHVQRVRSESKWAFPNDVLERIGAQHRRVLKEHALG